MNNDINIYEYPTDPAALPAYRIAVMQAALEGKPVQYRDGCEKWFYVEISSWNWGNADYRIDPASRPKTLKPWTIDTVPIGAWLRNKGSSEAGGISLLIGASVNGIYCCNGLRSPFPYLDVMNMFEHSIDSGRTWLPCGVES